MKDDEVLPAIVHAAADEANAREETLQLIHSSGEGLVPAPIEIGGPVLDRAAAMAVERAPNARLRIRASERPPAEALLDASRNASLLVIGAGHPRGAGHALGAVTHDVLVNINAPVLVVRPTA
ncbi:universal stress protein [Microbacterium luteolum]|uniref:universal stress protein n=1 Tax=Microbacterium luteolum TaxID=69367 RepID=UPI003CD08D08